jgi:hypothetical protein
MVRDVDGSNLLEQRQHLFAGLHAAVALVDHDLPPIALQDKAHVVLLDDGNGIGVSKRLLSLGEKSTHDIAAELQDTG